MGDLVGQQLGNYQIVRLLGRGGFAEVYLGQHRRLRTDAAIKVLSTHMHGTDADSFLAEAQTIAHLEHPHIVRVLDFDVKDGIPFLVMNYAPGGTLRARHEKGICVPPDQVIRYVNELASALQYAHSHRVIHRDIKPENMLLGLHDEVVLSDFGIATLVQSTYSMKTLDVAGTISYMSPEQIQGHPRSASDQYALAVVVYEWLCGRLPFEGTHYEVATKHIALSPPPLRSLNTSLSVQIEQVVLTALKKEPESRFDDMLTFAQALEEANKTSFFVSTQQVFAPMYVPVVATDDIDWLDENVQSQPAFATGLQRSYSDGDLSKISRFENKGQDTEKMEVPSRTEIPGNNRGMQRRSVIAAIATGGMLIVGSAAFAKMYPAFLTHGFTGAENTPVSHTSPTSLANVTTQQTVKSLSGTTTQNSAQRYNGIIIASTTLAINSAIVFTNPVDNVESLLICLPNGTYVAYERACTHQGVPVDYDTTTSTLLCPAHGSVFDPAQRGSVIRGPAPLPLRSVAIVVYSDGTITALS